MSGDQITVAMRKTYQGGVEHLLQQKGSRLARGCTRGMGEGKEAKLLDQLGPSTATERTIRHAETPISEAQWKARWAKPKTFEDAFLMDPTDTLQTLMDPSNKYAEAGAMSIGRAQDDRIIKQALGSNWVGEDGDETQAYDASMTIPVNTGASAATGLNAEKLKAANEQLLAAEVDIELDPLWLALTAKQNRNLQNQIEITSLDFNERPVMDKGFIVAWLGFRFIHCERLTVDANGYRRNLYWAQSGLHFVEWEGLFTSIDIRTDLSMAKQTYVRHTFDASRSEEKKVGDILSAET